MKNIKLILCSIYYMHKPIVSHFCLSREAFVECRSSYSLKALNEIKICDANWYIFTVTSV